MPKRTVITGKYYIGVDIGAKGAIVVQKPDNKVEIKVTPLIKNQVDLQKLSDYLEFYKGKNCIVVIEDLRGIYGASSKSKHTFGFIAGATEALIVAHKLPFVRVKASVWQKQLFVGVQQILKKDKLVKKNDTKAMALVAAKRLFPTVSFLASSRSTTPHDGIVDALLISEYAKRNNL
jgi:hypothetical protein